MFGEHENIEISLLIHTNEPVYDSQKKKQKKNKKNKGFR